MDLALIKLSLERLLEKVENLESQRTTLELRVRSLEAKNTSISKDTSTEQGELLDTKEVLKILGISYNTLQAIVRKNLIHQIRINQRRVRYSKKGIYEYIFSQSGLSKDSQVL